VQLTCCSNDFVSGEKPKTSFTGARVIRNISKQTVKLRDRLLILLLCAISPSLSVAEITYTQIADTADGVASFGLFPAINAAGKVAINGSAALGRAGIYVGDGGSLSNIAEFQGQIFSISTISSPTINDSGVVAFKIGSSGASTLYTGTAGALTIIAASDTTFNTFFGIPAINSVGTVAFGAALRNGSEAIYTANGGVLTAIAQTGPMFSSFHNNGGPSINNYGTVAFTVDQGNARGLGVFVSEQGNIQPLALTGTDLTISEGRPALNNDGTAAFLAAVRVNGSFTSAILKGNDESQNVVTTGNFSGTPALNDLGVVAYNAVLSNGDEAIFVNWGVDFLPLQVIATGDSLFGSTVTLLGLSTYGLNNANQLAFGAQLADGRTVIVRADINTVPEHLQLTIECASQSVILRTASVPGRLYTIEVATTLANFSDPPLVQDVPGTGEVLEFTDAMGDTQKYYRLVVRLAP
jgi:hypothetical protein